MNSVTQAQPEIECMTKTENGNIAIDTDLRSVFTGIWLLMEDSNTERIVKLYSEAITKTLLIKDDEKRIQRMIHILILVLSPSVPSS